MQSQPQSHSQSVGLTFRSSAPSAPVPIPTGATASSTASASALPLAFGSSTVSPSTSPQLQPKPSVNGSSAGAPSAVAVPGPVPKLAWCWANGFLYSAHFTDELYEYRLVQLPVQMAPVLCQLFAGPAVAAGASAVQFPTASKLKPNQNANAHGAGANAAPGCVERLLAEHEWRGIGIQQSVGWQHCAWWPLNGQPTHNHNHKLTLLFRRPRAPLLQLPRAVCHAQATQTASPQPQPQPQSASAPASLPLPASASASLSLVPGVHEASAVVTSEQQQLRAQLHALAHPNRHRMCVSSKRNLIPAPSTKLIATK